MINSWVEDNFIQLWEIHPGLRQTKNIVPLSYNKSQNLLLDKSEIRLLAGIFYCGFRYHQHILGNDENKQYRYCNITDETSEYILCIISHKDRFPRGSHLKKYLLYYLAG